MSAQLASIVRQRLQSNRWRPGVDHWVSQLPTPWRQAGLIALACGAVFWAMAIVFVSALM